MVKIFPGVLNSFFSTICFLVEMQRIRKDSETLSNSGYSTVSRARRDCERLRNDPNSADNPAHRNPPIIRDV
jgi:hypothetical protein